MIPSVSGLSSGNPTAVIHPLELLNSAPKFKGLSVEDEIVTFAWAVDSEEVRTYIAEPMGKDIPSDDGTLMSVRGEVQRLTLEGEEHLRDDVLCGRIWAIGGCDHSTRCIVG